MNCEGTEEHGEPYERVSALRTFDNEVIGIDWHDHLIKKRVGGKLYNVGDIFRPVRKDATGYQYRCTIAGVTSGAEFRDYRWPRTNGNTLLDGSATFMAEAIAATSLVSAVSSGTWIAPPGLTHANPFVDDLRYFVYVTGGVSGTDYENKIQLILANGLKKEGVVLLLIQD